MWEGVDFLTAMGLNASDNALDFLPNEEEALRQRLTRPRTLLAAAWLLSRIFGYGRAKDRASDVHNDAESGGPRARLQPFFTHEFGQEARRVGVAPVFGAQQLVRCNLKSCFLGISSRTTLDP